MAGGPGSRGGTFQTHTAVPERRHDDLGRTVWKCRDCTRRVYERIGGRGRNPDARVWVHSPARRARGRALPLRSDARSS